MKMERGGAGLGGAEAEGALFLSDGSDLSDKSDGESGTGENAWEGLDGFEGKLEACATLALEAGCLIFVRGGAPSARFLAAL